MSATAGPAVLFPITLLRCMAPLETCPAKCVALNELPSVRNSYLKKLHTRVKLMTVLTECADVSFTTTDTVVASLSNIWVSFGGKHCKGPQVSV